MVSFTVLKLITTISNMQVPPCALDDLVCHQLFTTLADYIALDRREAHQVHGSRVGAHLARIFIDVLLACAHKAADNVRRNVHRLQRRGLHRIH